MVVVTFHKLERQTVDLTKNNNFIPHEKCTLSYFRAIAGDAVRPKFSTIVFRKVCWA
jgi:hypothetical protein